MFLVFLVFWCSGVSFRFDCGSTLWSTTCKRPGHRGRDRRDTQGALCQQLETILACCGGKKRGNPSAPQRARQSSQSKVLVLISQIHTLATWRAGKRKSKSRKDSAREGPAAGWDPGVLQAGGRKKTTRRSMTYILRCGGQGLMYRGCHILSHHIDGNIQRFGRILASQHFLVPLQVGEKHFEEGCSYVPARHAA